MNPQIQQLQEQVDRLRRDLESITKAFYLNNFPSHQDYNKTSSFNYMLKVPHYAVAPSVNEVGYIIEVGGKLYISTAVDTWTMVGTQS